MRLSEKNGLGSAYLTNEEPMNFINDNGKYT